MAELPSGTVTFLFTDIEGSTQLLKQLGPAYGEALGEHQQILRAAFAAHGGQEVDTQGDSFFVAFRRAKDTVAAAADAQRDLTAHPWPGAQPLRVRMGLHTGEPRLSSERYVGLGVHKAARVAAAGHGGQVLLSRTTRDLVEDELPAGVTLVDLGERRLKDLDRPEALSQLVIEGLQSEFAPLRTLDEELREKRRRMYLGSAAIGVLAAAIAIPVFALGQGSSSSQRAVAPNSLAAIDSVSNRLIGSVPVGIRPAALAAGASSIWVVNVEDQTISRIDPTQLTLQRTIPLTTTPTGIAFGAGGAWVANGPAGSVMRIDPGTNAVTDTVALTNDATAGFPSVGEGAVWVVFANAFLARVDPVQPRMVSSGLAGTGPAGIAAGNGAVWVANSGDNSVSRILPETATVSATITVGRHPAGIALGEGGVWVTDQGDDTVTRIDLGSGSETTIQVGGGPTGIAVGDGAVWVANSDDGTISRIDPATRSVVATIVVGNRPAGVVVAGDRVFASIQATT